MPILWEPIKGETIEAGRVRPFGTTIFRARVPGGWLVREENGSPFFLPDADHSWEKEVAPDDASKGVQSTVNLGSSHMSITGL